MIVSEERPTHKKRRGFALMFVMVFAAVITVFTASVGAQATYNLRLANQRGEVDRAYYSAQTGTQLILSLLREPPPVFDYDGDTVTGTWLGEDGSVNLSIPEINSEAIAHVYHNIQGFPHATNVAPDGTTIPPDHFYIISIGVVNGVYDAGGDLQSGAVYEANTMGATLNPIFPITPHAIFAYEQVNVDGIVGHFDSRATAPWAQETGAGTTCMDCDFPDASVGIAQSDETRVEIGPTAQIDGHIVFAQGTGQAIRQAESDDIGGTPQPPVPADALSPRPVSLYGYTGGTAFPSPPSTNPNVNGVIDELAADKPLPEVDLNNLTVANLPHPHSPSITLEEDSVYVLAGPLNITGGNTITINDTDGDGELLDVTLVVEGDVNINGAAIGANGVTAPRNLKIYVKSPGTVATIEGGAVYYGLIAGDDLTVTVRGNSEIWGAVLAKEVTLEANSIVNFDVALRDPLLIADIYGHYLVGATISSGASVPTGTLGPSGGTPAAPPPAAPPPAPPATPPPAAPPAAGCGCGCGCGSMLMMLKV